MVFKTTNIITIKNKLQIPQGNNRWIMVFYHNVNLSTDELKEHDYTFYIAK